MSAGRPRGGETRADGGGGGEHRGYNGHEAEGGGEEKRGAGEGTNYISVALLPRSIVGGRVRGRGGEQQVFPQREAHHQQGRRGGGTEATERVCRRYY